MTRVRTSLALAPSAFLTSFRRSGILRHDFLENLVQVALGAALGGEAGQGREFLHVGLVLSMSVSCTSRRASARHCSSCFSCSSYVWLGLEALAHCAQNVDLAGGEAGGIGCFAGRDVVSLLWV
jgi:hypothetical protein